MLLFQDSKLEGGLASFLFLYASRHHDFDTSRLQSSDRAPILFDFLSTSIIQDGDVLDAQVIKRGNLLDRILVLNNNVAIAFVVTLRVAKGDFPNGRNGKDIGEAVDKHDDGD